MCVCACLCTPRESVWLGGQSARGRQLGSRVKEATDEGRGIRERESGAGNHILVITHDGCLRRPCVREADRGRERSGFSFCSDPLSLSCCCRRRCCCCCNASIDFRPFSLSSLVFSFSPVIAISVRESVVRRERDRSSCCPSRVSIVLDCFLMPRFGVRVSVASSRVSPGDRCTSGMQLPGFSSLQECIWLPSVSHVLECLLLPRLPSCPEAWLLLTISTSHFLSPILNRITRLNTGDVAGGSQLRRLPESGVAVPLPADDASPLQPGSL